MRALRPGKLTLAALEATLRLYVAGPDTAHREIPVINMLSAASAPLERQAKRLHDRMLRKLRDSQFEEAVELQVVEGASAPRRRIAADRRAPNILRCRLPRRWAPICRWPKARFGSGARYAGCDARATRPGTV